ncbi:uncharacterized protein LOC128745682 [Sabethes cyaneus]|uniref:uncharacterized protein LOC128745682 n=1 Tax=Sabethes cyaneus TaxID=53552 RepID=UPI00237E4EAB|nr:uncharacterized protein LOC128745682 [Sabethes cyaneus]
MACNLATTADIHRDLQRFWAIEDDSTPIYSPQEALCEKHFCENVIRDEDGRYTVRLPLKEEVISKLRDNRRTAFHRFRMLEARLNRNPQLAEKYKEFMQEYITLGHMERIDESHNTSQPAFFLPHHPVIREDSSTTQVRVVFDASCKSTTGVSLNDAMLVGPVIQEDLRSILMRSRMRPVALIADVAKMYRQIRLGSDDTPLHRIFWRFSPVEPVAVYELKTVTYGTASAPFLVTRVLKKLAEDENENYPAAAKATCEDFYVDDFYSGADSIERAVTLRQQIDAMFSSAGMKLRKWASNETAALEGMSEADLALQSSVHLNKDQSIKTLGLHWEPSTDKLKYVIREEQIDIPTAVTKRATLSRIAKLFDPLGLVGPVVLIAKIFMQTLWTLRDENGKPWEWDRELPQLMIERWNSYRSQLSLLNDLRIDRFISCSNPSSLELHLFSDASQMAYGCCCYIRSVNSSGETKVALLTSRSKVSPLAQQTIPRLELCAAQMAAEMYTKVQSALRFTGRTFFWVDSKIVLSWLKASPTSWTTFVANRVSRIQQSTQDCKWNYVPGTDNPADHISRGLLPIDLLHNEVWWEGPKWLRKESESWPLQTVELSGDAEVLKEARKTTLSLPVASEGLYF